MTATEPCSGSRVLAGMNLDVPSEIVMPRLDERRYALAIDGIVRYVGTEEECQQRLAMLVPKNDRARQDEALGRLWRTNAVILGRADENT